MALAFLAKKSFHTTNVKNVEKVWLAEQKAGEEKKKLVELQKQIEEERQIQELRQLQAASGYGGVKNAVDNTLDWMYQGPSSSIDMQKSSEDYLLGKIYKANDSAASKLDVSIPLNKKTDAWVLKVSSKNDTFSRVHEDPIVLIKQEEKKSLENVLKNPIKMDRIRQKLAMELKEKEEEKKKKKLLKKEKKEKDHDLKKRKHEQSDRHDRHDEIFHSQYDGNPLERRGKYAKYDDDYDVDSRRKNRNDIVTNESKHDFDDEKKRFGLVKTNSTYETGSNQDLGPNRNLLQKKLEQKQQEEDRIRLLLNKNKRNDMKSMTDEERSQRLKSMQEDAERLDTQRLHKSLHKNDAKEDHSQPTKFHPQFLNSMRNQVYNANENQMKDRIDQNKHYIQRRSDLDSDNFLKK